MANPIKVKKAEGIKMLRDALGYPYPDGEFDTEKTTFVSRRIKAGDLLWTNKPKPTKLKTEGGKNVNS